MLIAVIPVRDYALARCLIKSVVNVDGIEIRLDYLQTVDLEQVKTLLDATDLPVIFTLRNINQGGFYPDAESKRYHDLLALCTLNPDYLDLEYNISADLIETIAKTYPNIKLIISYHNFSHTPLDLIEILQMLYSPWAHAYKLSTTANSTIDALRMLSFIRDLQSNYKITGICMGEHGQVTRILSPIIGGYMSYAILSDDHKTAPGQLTIYDMLNIYRYRSLNFATKIYALLGNPVNLSIGHIFHNNAFNMLNKNAVYIKLCVLPEELGAVLALCRKLLFSGFSITMPLKELIMPFLDVISNNSIKAINTISYEREKLIGFNTDGKGAIDALLSYVRLNNKTVIILGAGGAARAIVYEALKLNAHVIILNRTLIRAQKLANEFGCIAGHLSQLESFNYHVIINTIPNNILTAMKIKSQVIAMDVVYQPRVTSFLNAAKKSNCICISGEYMYINQAVLQLKLWYNLSEEECHRLRANIALDDALS